MNREILIFTYFIYGLAFFILGVAFWIYPRQKSRLSFARHLWLLSLFGLVHACLEWLDMFTLIIPDSVPSTKALRLVFLTSSFCFLLQFGVNSLLSIRRDRHSRNALCLFLFFAWAGATMLTPEKVLYGDIIARYFIGLPATLLTSLALFLHAASLKDMRGPGLPRNFLVASISFFLYGVTAGFFVPEAPVFPASVFNAPSFLETTGLPVQVVRAACAVVITLSMTRVLTIFDLETAEALEQTHIELERRVRERTENLRSLNAELEAEVAERRRVEKALQKRIEMEQVIADVSSKLINLSPRYIVSGIQYALERIGAYAGTDRAYVFLFSDDLSHFSNVYEWCADGVESQTGRLQTVSSKGLPWIIGKITRHETVRIQSVDDLGPYAGAEKAHWRDQGIRSLVVHPMAYGNAVIGFLGFDSVSRERSWTDDDVRLLSMAGEALAGVLEMKKSGDGLKASKDQFQSLFESSPVPLWLEDFSLVKSFLDELKQVHGQRLGEYLKADPSYVGAGLSRLRVVDVNQASLDLYGAGSKEELIRRLGETFSRESLEAFRNALSAIAEGRLEFEFEAITKTLAGRKIHNTVKWSVVPGHEKTLSRVVVSIIDITERKLMEEELLRANKLESVAILAGGIAHDFNNLLTAIIGNISLAKTFSEPGDELSEILEHAETASVRASHLTKRLITFSHGGTPVKKTTSPAELIQATALFSLSGSNVRCDFDIKGDLWPVEIDEGQIDQVISNIVINAREAMPEGGSILVSAENVVVRARDGSNTPRGDYVRISIADKGEGIPKENLPKIFDPYFSTKTMGSGRGTGLGLAICYSVMKSHGGHISVESEVGKGSTFSLYLPALPHGHLKEEFCRKPEAAVSTGGDGRDVPASASEGPRQPRILLMDDEGAVLEAASDMLRSLGFEAVPARDGGEAVEIYRKEMDAGRPFHAVILDLTVPGGMGGKETLDRLIAIDGAVKAIISSGYTEDAVVARFREHGFAAAIAKPYTIQELRETLGEVVPAG